MMIKNTDDHFKTINELLKINVDIVDDLYFTAGSKGLARFDDVTFDTHTGELIIMVGYSSMRASSLIINIIENIAINKGKTVAVFSMSLSAESIILYMMSSQANIDVNKIRNGQLDDDEWPCLTEAVHILNEASIFIDDTPALSLGEIQNRLQYLNLKHDIGLVVIDSLQLMQLKTSSEKLPYDLSTISNELKAMAKDMNIPLIALSDA